MKCDTCGSIMKSMTNSPGEKVIGLSTHYYNCETCGRSESQYGLEKSVRCIGLHPQHREIMTGIKGYWNTHCLHCGELDVDCKCSEIITSLREFGRKMRRKRKNDKK